MEFKPYNKKAFLLPDSINSAAMYHAKIFPDGKYMFRIHDCLTGIRLIGELKEQKDFDDAFAKASTLSLALADFAFHVDKLKIDLFPESDTGDNQLTEHKAKTAEV